MASREPSARAKKSVSLSVILGTLLVPLSAFAASNLVESTAAPGTSITAAASPVAETVVTEPASPARDLETACGEAGLAMVAAEAAGSMDDLQQAALDALRGVCAEQGTPLPTPPTIRQWSQPPSRPRLPPPRRSIRPWSHWTTPTTGTITADTGMTITTMTVTTTTKRITIEPVLHPRCHRVGRTHRRAHRPSSLDHPRNVGERSVVPVRVSGPATIEGLDPSVQRVLQSEGWARVLTTEELAAIPPTVARTLVEYGAALTLPLGGNE